MKNFDCSITFSNHHFLPETIERGKLKKAQGNDFTRGNIYPILGWYG